MRAKKCISVALSLLTSCSLLFNVTTVANGTDNDPFIVPIDFSVNGLGCPNRPNFFTYDENESESQNEELDRVPLPMSVDLSSDPAFPPVGDQGSIQSCSSWATTYYAYTYMVHKAKGITSTATNAYSPRWTNNMLNGGINVGCYANEAFQVLENQGALTMSDYPYQIDGCYSYYWSTDTQAMVDALSTRVSSHSSYTVPCDYGATFQVHLSTIKSGLNNNKPYVASLKCTIGLTNSTLKYCSDSNHLGQSIYVRVSSTTSSGAVNGGHTVTIVGYDDSVWCDVNENNVVDTGETGAFKIVNSWGTDFGNSGYAWVLYDSLLLNSRIMSAANSSVTWDSSMTTVRHPFFAYADDDNNTFYYCDIMDYTVGYVSEVTLSTTRRNQLQAYSAYKYYNSSNTIYTQIYTGVGNVNNDISFNGTIVLNHPQTSSISYYLSNYSFGVYLKDRASDSYATNVISCKLVDNLENTIKSYYSGGSLNGSHITVTTPINLLRGDIDYSGVLTVSDADTILEYIALIIDFSNVQKVLADYNQDGHIDVGDVVDIKSDLLSKGIDVSEIDAKIQQYLTAGLIE